MVGRQILKGILGQGPDEQRGICLHLSKINAIQPLRQIQRFATILA